MRVNQIGIAPRPLQGPHPPLYGGFAASMRTALFWAKDMMWLWQSWATPFGQGVPELLIGSPDTISRRLDQVKQALPDQEEVVLLIPQGCTNVRKY